MRDGYYQADFGAVCACFAVMDGNVTDETAPILKWARQKPALTLDRWVKGKGGTVVMVAAFDVLPGL